MKKVFLLLAAVVCATVCQAQQTDHQGFYINPNLKFQSVRSIPNRDIRITPEINLGYLIKKNRHRHNFSLNGLHGAISKVNSHGLINLRYAYDLQILQRKKFTFYVSPFISTNIALAKSKYYGFINRNSAIQFSYGIMPQAEVKIGKRLDFIATTPLTLGGLNFNSSYARINQNETRKSYTYWNQGAPSVQANVGIRLNLFQKK